MSLPGLLVAKHPEGDRWIDLSIVPQMANRHGLIAGATGTGKTVTLQSIAQRFSDIGVPVFMADVKGDLSGLSQPGDSSNKKVNERITQLGLVDFKHSSCPVRFWDVFGTQGLPMRATISEMGPLLLGRLLGLNDTQSGVLTLTFRVADDNGLLLLDLKDLRAMVQHVGDNAKEYKTQYGNVAPASVGAIQRALLRIEQEGGTSLFGEPAIALSDVMQTDANGKGVISILASDQLLNSPRVYASFLLWLLSELFEELPEVGDLEKPKLVFFFDEAHLLFNDAPKALVDKIEQVVRLIRSKAVGVYFVTQNPTDIPDAVLGQLGNRVQHALRALTPRDQKAVRAAAETFRTNEDLDVAAAITELAVGEALVSFLDEKGMPGIVQRGLIVPPESRIGPIDAATRTSIVKAPPLYQKYHDPIDRESAFERLTKRVGESIDDAEPETPKRETEAQRRESAKVDREAERRETARKRAVDGILTSFLKSAARSLGTALGQVVRRGPLGSVTGRTSRRR